MCKRNGLLMRRDSVGLLSPQSSHSSPRWYAGISSWLTQWQHDFPHVQATARAVRVDKPKSEFTCLDSSTSFVVLVMRLYDRSLIQSIGSKVKLQHGPECDYVNADWTHVTNPSTPIAARCSGPYTWYLLVSWPCPFCGWGLTWLLRQRSSIVLLNLFCSLLVNKCSTRRAYSPGF